MFFPLGVLSQYVFGTILFILSLFIVAIILLQRGKGGGLTGALGGLGGQSAFGVKAGDVFTRITAVAVLLWIFFCALACYWYRPEGLDIEADLSSSSSIGGSSLDLGAPSVPSPAATGTENSSPTPGVTPEPSGVTPSVPPPATGGVESAPSVPPANGASETPSGSTEGTAAAPPSQPDKLP